MPSGVTHTLDFVHLGIILILVLGFYSGLSGWVTVVYLFSLCVVSLLSSRFTASALVWFSNCLNNYKEIRNYTSRVYSLVCTSLYPKWAVWRNTDRKVGIRFKAMSWNAVTANSGIHQPLPTDIRRGVKSSEHKGDCSPPSSITVWKVYKFTSKTLKCIQDVMFTYRIRIGIIQAFLHLRILEVGVSLCLLN
jgi:hypothetical protein